MAVTGTQRLAVLLCKVSDDPAEPRPLSFMRDLIANRGKGGLNDYWIAVSGGLIDLDTTDVFDWRQLSQTRAEFIAARPSRRDKIDGAIAAFPDVDMSQYSGFVAVFNTSLGDGGAAGNGVLVGPPGDLNVTWLGHETGHVLGLAHSFDRSDRKTVSWSQPGEYYDPYDLMSAMNVDHGNSDLFGATGPLLCTANLDRMGWLPTGRVWLPPYAGSSFTSLVDLVSLGHPEVPGNLAAVVDDLYMELRTPDGWDSGLPRAGVLIHRLAGMNAIILAPTLPPKPGVPTLHPKPGVPILHPKPGVPVNIGGGREPYRQDWQAGQTFAPDDLTLSLQGGTSVSVISIDEAAHTARISIQCRVAPLHDVGPGSILGGVTNGGGGWLILPSGKVVKVPPHSPVINTLEVLAVATELEGTATGDMQRQLNQVTARELDRVANQLRG
jgi:hypothetical protein